MCGDKLMQRIKNESFELPLNQEAKFIVDFSKYYGDVYFDSTLYFYNGIKKYGEQFARHIFIRLKIIQQQR